MIVLHLGGVPEIAMVAGPLLLIAAFLRIARRNDAAAEAEELEDDWDPDLGDLPPASLQTPGLHGRRVGR